MLTITDKAQAKIAELLKDTGKPVKGLRIRAEARSPIKASYQLAFILEGQEEPDDTVVKFERFDAYIGSSSLPHLEEATVDYVDGPEGSGFKIDSPLKLPPHLEGPLARRVLSVIDEKINPGIAGHGGFVSLLDIKDNVVYVQMGGGCRGCGMASVTMKQGVEVAIKEAVPEITEVLDVTDHAGGKNPYYEQAR